MKRILSRPAIIGVVTLAIFLGLLLAIPSGKAPTPLPFNTNNYVSSSIYDPWAIPPNAPLRQRVAVAIFKWTNRKTLEHPDPDSTTFGAWTGVGVTAQVGLNSCSQASGTRYYMPDSVAVGMVPFGVSAPMKGGAFIAGFEKALTNAPIDCYDTNTHRYAPQQLVLIRFPSQRAVLVLPKAEADEFIRTNSVTKAKSN